MFDSVLNKPLDKSLWTFIEPTINQMKSKKTDNTTTFAGKPQNNQQENKLNVNKNKWAASF